MASTRIFGGLLAIFLGITFAATPLLAHDYWLEATKSRLEVGGSAAVDLRFGESLAAGQSKPLQLPRTTEFRLYGQSRKYADLRASRPENTQPVAQLTFSKEGTQLVTMERSPAEISFGRAKFLEYASMEGFAISNLELPESTRRVQESYTRYLKTILQVGPTPTKTALKVVGQKYEIVLLTNPYVADLSKMNFKLLFDGKAAAGVKLTAIQRLNGKLTSVSTMSDKKGKCTLSIQPAGFWLVRSVKIVPDRPGSVVQESYHSYWSALTFGYD